MWNGIELRTNLQKLDHLVLRSWFEQALDINEEYVDKSPETGFLHSLDYSSEDGYLSLFIDFGTAPVSAFVELLEILRNQGETSVSIGSWGYKC
ncbi:MAG: hypothetical protein ACFCBU_05010 [Cyanophyceae cyanobacterium]